MISHLEPARAVAHRVPVALKSARNRLRNASYAALRNVTCEYNRGVLTLHGQVPSWFQKQLAQEAVRSVSGIRQIINEIEVFVPGDSRLR